MCFLWKSERVGCLGLVVFLLGKRELVAKVWLCSCWGRERWLVRSGCVLAGEESWLLRFGDVLDGTERAGCLGLVVFLLGKRELVA